MLGGGVFPTTMNEPRASSSPRDGTRLLEPERLAGCCENVNPASESHREQGGRWVPGRTSTRSRRLFYFDPRASLSPLDLDQGAKISGG